MNPLNWTREKNLKGFHLTAVMSAWFWSQLTLETHILFNPQISSFCSSLSLKIYFRRCLCTHRCILYNNVGWSSLKCDYRQSSYRKITPLPFITALSPRWTLPNLIYRLAFTSPVLQVRSERGKTSFSFRAADSLKYIYIFWTFYKFDPKYPNTYLYLLCIIVFYFIFFFFLVFLYCLLLFSNEWGSPLMAFHWLSLVLSLSDWKS